MPSIYATKSIPTGQRKIRILRVQADTNRASGLSCELEVISLDDSSVSFTALSYVWRLKDDDELLELNCEGDILRVTRNGLDALRHLRDKLGTFVIWMDAVSIDQDNEQEKLDQIDLMGDIYSKAETVYVWLGTGNAACDRAITFLEHSKFQQFFRWDEESHDISVSENQLRKVASAYIRGRLVSIGNEKGKLRAVVRKLNRASHQTSFQDLIALLDNLWITRIWTFQEILLATKPVLVVGQDHLDWVSLERAILFLQHSGTCARSNSQLDQVLEIWTELILSRDQLVTPNIASTPDFKSTRHTNLLNYRDVIVDMSEHVRSIRSLISPLQLVLLSLTFFLGLGVVATLIGLGLTYIKLTTKEMQDVLDASTDSTETLTKCLKTCVNTASTQCLHNCTVAREAVDLLSDKLETLKSAFANGGKFYVHPAMISIPIAFGLCVAASLPLYLVYGPVWNQTSGPVYPPARMTIDIVKNLCTRRCRDPRDKTAAMRAVLQRFSGQDIKLLDPSSPLWLSYQRFSKQLIESTASMALLIPAALCSIEGAPCWVPDWVNVTDPFWLDAALLAGHPADATPGSSSFYRWDCENDNVLLVRGLAQDDHVVRCFSLVPTQDIYSTDDDAVHLRNLDCWQYLWRQRIFLSDLLDIVRMVKKVYGSNNSALTVSRLKDWSTYMETRSHDTMDQLFKSLFTEPELSRVRLFHSDIFRLGPAPTVRDTHIAISNILARHGKVFFTTGKPEAYHSHASTDPRYLAHVRRREAQRNGLSEAQDRNELGWQLQTVGLGIGEPGIQVGDKVVLIGGVRLPLILRQGVEGKPDKLVSPANIPRLMFGHGWSNFIRTEDMMEFRLG